MMIFSILILLVTAWGLNELYRLHRLSKAIDHELDRVFTARVNGDRSVEYPDIRKTYSNLKWYDVFNYKFKSMIIYDSAH